MDDASLNRLRGIPFWEKALETEQKAGALVGAYAATVSDPLLRAAIALQGREETRHARLIKTLIERYGIEITEPPGEALPSNIEQAFTFDDRLLQPQLMPAIATAALRTLQFSSRLKPRNQAKIGMSENSGTIN